MWKQRRHLSAVLVAGLVTLTLPAVAGAAAGASSAQAASSFTASAPPVRVLDTRNGTGVTPGAVPKGATITLDLGPHLATGTTAVVLNLTAVSPSHGTFVTVWPAGTPRPGSSNLNVRTGEIRSNSVTVPVGAGRTLNLYNHSGSTHLVADLVGYYGPGLASWFNSVAPQRVLDTRGTGKPFHGLTGRTVSVAGLVPPATTSVVLNVTAVRSTLDTYLTVFEDIFDEPPVSSVNAMRGEITANLVTVELQQPETRFAVTNHAGTVDVVIDLVGYYSPDEGAAFHPVDPVRAYDSRTTQWLPPGATRRIPLSTPVPATSALVNLTGVANFRDTYLTAFPAGQPRPGTSTLNLAAGQTASNQAMAELGARQGIDVYNNSGSTHVIVDVFGYFVPRS